MPKYCIGFKDANRGNLEVTAKEIGTASNEQRDFLIATDDKGVQVCTFNWSEVAGWWLVPEGTVCQS